MCSSNKKVVKFKEIESFDCFYGLSNQKVAKAQNHGVAAETKEIEMNGASTWTPTYVFRSDMTFLD